VELFSNSNQNRKDAGDQDRSNSNMGKEQKLQRQTVRPLNPQGTRSMQILYVRNGKFEAEALDGEIVNVRNLNSPDHGNLSDDMLFHGGRLAIVFGVDDGSAKPSMDWDGPGDISRNSIDFKG
jgi:hypothetical protein